jgi:protein-tyrosine phosphatase
MLEQLCATYGTTTEGAFRTALDGADLDRILDAAGLPDSERTMLATWRGTLPR